MADLLKISDAPARGVAFISYRDHTELRRYEDKAALMEEIKLNLGSLLEVHMFDADTEYRAVLSRKAQTGYVEALVTDPKGAEKYEEEIYVEDMYKSGINKVCAVNYISYDKDDLLSITNYRLKEVGTNG